MRYRHADHHHSYHSHNDHAQQSTISRRQIVAGLGAAGLSIAAAPPSLAGLVKPIAQTGARAAAGSLFRIERVSDSVYAAIARPVAMINSNAAIIVGSDHALVVDTHSKPSAAQALISQIRAEITDRPVRYCINSHFHWDHAQGNIAYPDAFGPRTEIISSTATREWLAREGAPRLRQSLESLPKQIAERRAQLASAKTDAERERLTETIAQMEAYLKEMNPPEKQIALPTITFDQRLIIHHGGREVHLIFFGRGHTAGDVIVYIPSERVIATGDLMHGILPYMGDGYPDEWPRTLKAVEELDFNRVVPGHGSVQQGKSILVSFRNYLDEINEAVTRGVERGAKLEELQRSLAPERLRSLTAGGNGARIERELAAAFGSALAPSLKDGVANNIADVYNYYTRRKK